MNNLRQGASRLAKVCCSSIKSNSSKIAGVVASRNLVTLNKPNIIKLTPTANFVRSLSTRGDQEIFEFLKSEIAAEKKAAVLQAPAKLGDFDVSVDKAFVTLKRKFNDEIITISIDVNHSVDAEAFSTAQSSEDVELKSKPSFEVDVKKGDTTLSFTCSFLSPEEGEEPRDADVAMDVFGINEVTMFQGEHDEKDYCVSGDILDETLYDLLLNFLEERGISDQFAQQLTGLCSDYEHSLYVGLLEKIQNFVK